MIVTDGGRFGGYALFLSRSYSYWLEDEAFIYTALGLLAVGLVLTWLANQRGWKGIRLRLGQGLVSLAALYAVAVVGTAIFGFGKGRPVFLYNLLDLERTSWAGPTLGAGKHTIVFDFKSDGPGLGKGGTGVLSVDGKEMARNTLAHGTPIMFPEDETFDVGRDTRSGVALPEYRYDVPFKFTGKIDKLTFKLEPQPEDTEKKR